MHLWRLQDAVDTKKLDNKNDINGDALEPAGEIRRTKSEAKKPLRTPVVDFHLQAPAAELAAFERARTDVASSGLVQQVRTAAAEARQATVVLGELEASSSEVGA